VRLLLTATAGVILASPPDRAVAQRPSQDQVEAAYLYNFGKFVHWPDSAAQGVLQICVVGQEQFEMVLTRLVAGEQINGRRLEARLLNQAQETQGCAILFVGAAQQTHLDEFLAATASRPILTVGDGSDFLAHGGILQFVMVEDHVRFAVNLNAANRNGLSLSSELLKVAVAVIGRPENGGAR
jgi:hypothetical protein